MTNSETCFYPNRMGRIILLSMEEVMGRNGVNSVLKLASLPELIDAYPPDTGERTFPFPSIGNIMDVLEKSYGPHGGRGLALRVGRACFNNGVRQYGTQIGLTEMAFRLLPLPQKLTAGAQAFAGLFNTFTDQRVRVEVENGTLLWHIDRCPLCWGRKTQDPACHLAVGLLQEALYWLSGGKMYSVEEKTCIATGDASCTIVIHSTPIF